MSTIVEPVTVKEFLALPDNGIHRELIRGEVRERGMTVRNRIHSRIMRRLTTILGNWYDNLLEPRGDLLVGDAGFRLKSSPDSLVGIDLAYASPELYAETPTKQAFYNGAPLLAVEILSPSDRHDDVVEKVALYLESGTVVWLVDPYFQTVTIHRPGRAVEALGVGDQLTGEPELPGFSVTIETLFDI